MDVHASDHEWLCMNECERVRVGAKCALLGMSECETLVCVLLSAGCRHHGAGVSLIGHDGQVKTISLSHDDKLALTASADCTGMWSLPREILCEYVCAARLWNVETGA